MKFVSILICSFLFLAPSWAEQHTIEQVHLSLGTDVTEMVVTWTIPKKDVKDKGYVHYGTESSKFDHKVNAEVQHFSDSKAHYSTFRALLTGLQPGHVYYYKIELGDSQSAVLKFRNLKQGADWLPRLAIYGDLGYKNEQSLPYLSKDVLEHDMFDAIFHIGDFAYDLHDKSGETGNKFMRSIEPVASRVPYMACPGNHERHGNFSHYDSRFSMIGDRHNPQKSHALSKRLNNHFHSMKVGPASIIMFSTEYYYYTEYGWDQIVRQYHWLEQELKRANAEREKYPWIIVMGHRPLYCLKLGDSSCNHETLERESIRQGIKMHGEGQRKYGLEELFFKYGVDIQFYGHEHFYARLLPIHQYQIKSGHHSSNPYDHADGPIHITTGSAGNKELHPKFNHLQNWVANHFYDYGYTRMMFQDKYKIKFQQVSDDKHGEVLDEFVVEKSSDYPHWMP